MSHATYLNRRKRGLCGQCGKVRTGIRARCNPCNAQLRSYKGPMTDSQRTQRAAYMRGYYRANSDKWRANGYTRRYGITLEQVNAMLRKQRHGCAVCRAKIGESARGRRLMVDHCHKTHRVRGILCGACNGALAFLHDSTRLVGRLHLYMRGVL